MHRLLAFFLLSACLLYSGCSTAPKVTSAPKEKSAPSPTAEVKAPESTPNPVERLVDKIMSAVMEQSPAATAQTPAPAPTVEKPPAFIALLLPMHSASYGNAAEIVYQGFTVGYSLATPVKLYPTGDDADNILNVYQRAVDEGAKAVVGPLTRFAVSAIANSTHVSVPTLALSLPETGTALPRKLFVFGLAVEAEAKQIADMAFDPAKPRALIIQAEFPLAQRMTKAFESEWLRQGGKITAHLNFSDKTADYYGLRNTLSQTPFDVVFLATNAAQAGLVHPYLDAAHPVYGTSHIFNGKNSMPSNPDLEGIRFVDMPWMLQPDHPAVMVYARPDSSYDADLERVYALGIDAARLVVYLLTGTLNHDIVLDGVTGQIRQNGQEFIRTLPEAQFQQGTVLLLDDPLK